MSRERQERRRAKPGPLLRLLRNLFWLGNCMIGSRVIAGEQEGSKVAKKKAKKKSAKRGRKAGSKKSARRSRGKRRSAAARRGARKGTGRAAASRKTARKKTAARKSPKRTSAISAPIPAGEMYGEGNWRADEEYREGLKGFSESHGAEQIAREAAEEIEEEGSPRRKHGEESEEDSEW